MCSKKLIKEYVLDLVYSKEQILRLAECNKENPNYYTYLNILEELIQEHGDKIIPKAYVVTKEKNDYMKEGSFGVISCLVTLGSDIDKLVKESFDCFDYLEALFLNGFGDSVLFESSNMLYKRLKEDVKDEGLYMSTRQEPGDVNINMETQKDIFNNIKSYFTVDVKITEGNMLNPKKSLLYFYNLLDKDVSNGVDHSCERCSNLNCVNRMKHSFVSGEISECNFRKINKG